MKVELFIGPVYDEIRKRSHIETQEIEDVELRDTIRLGEDKSDLILRCIADSNSALLALIRRFLEKDNTLIGSNSSIPTSSSKYEYNFALSSRKLPSAAHTLPGLIHDYIVEMSLSKCYSNSKATQYASSHANTAAATLANLLQFLYLKTPPTPRFL